MKANPITEIIGSTEVIRKHYRKCAMMALLLLVMLSKGIQAQQWADTVVLVSLDGFRSTYVDDYDISFLDALIGSGVS